MKHKEIFIYLLLFISIIFSFVLPKIITHQEEKKIFSQIYVADKKVQAKDSKDENIELINTIDSKYHNSQKYKVNVSDTNREIKQILRINDNQIIISDETKVLNRIEELVRQNIVNSQFFKDLIKEETILYRVWDYDNGEVGYSKTKIFTSGNLEKAMASIEVENSTNKIIGFTFKKEYIRREKNDLEKYSQYLELNLFNDWEYTNHELKSEEAGVKIISTEENEYSNIKIVPKDYFRYTQ